MLASVAAVTGCLQYTEPLRSATLTLVLSTTIRQPAPVTVYVPIPTGVALPFVDRVGWFV